MVNRTYDAIVFGATGFTGYHIALNFAKTQVEKEEKEQYRFAIAGRSESKLNEVAKRVKEEAKFKGNVDVVVASSDDPASLDAMCAKARIILSAVGPFRLYGEPLIAACVKNKTHYVDITGETEFMHRMAIKYHEEAKINKTLLVNACGFDSIPADIGVLFTTNEAAKQDVLLSSIEGFVSANPGPKGYTVNTGTWESLVYGIENMSKLQGVRKELDNKRGAQVEFAGPKREVKKRPFFEKEVTNRWNILFPGSDVAVVRNSQQIRVARGENGPLPQYLAYFSLNNLLSLVLLFLFGIIFFVFSRFACGRRLLLKYPRIFSGGLFSSAGPTKEQMEQMKFQIDFYGRGYRKANAKDVKDKAPDSYIRTRVSGPDPGYIGTAAMIVQTALCVLRDEENLPKGVLTPGAAFDKTNLVDMLNHAGIKFEVIKSGNL